MTRLESRISDREISHEANLSPFSEGGGGPTFRPSTLHTNDAPSAVMRLVDLGVEPYLLSSCLRGVLAQRLVRKVCRRCGVKVPAGTEIREARRHGEKKAR